MNFPKEHSYGLFKAVKTELDEPTTIDVSKLNIKMERESQESTDLNHTEEIRQNVIEQSLHCDNITVNNRNLKSEECDTDSERSVSTVSNSSLSDFQKAYILQTCMSLLDSSSDDDELVLLWLLRRNKKRKLRKRHRII